MTLDRNEPERSHESVSRREALKKGAMIGGTFLWVAPVVQTIGMTAASAQTTSGTGGAPKGGSKSSNAASVAGIESLAVTGSNVDHAVELGLTATALGVVLTKLSRVKENRHDEPGDDGAGTAP